MELDEVKQRLESVKWINKEIEGLYLELGSLESGIIKKQQLSSARVQTSRINTTENDLISVLKLKDDILQRIERLTEERMEISKIIDKLENPLERFVIRLLYFNNLIVDEIVDEIGRSRTIVYQIRLKALENLVAVVNAD